MKLYLIGGLGADERVFEHLDLTCDFQVIEWVNPNNKESLSSYTERLIAQIDTSEKFMLLGVSFGGIIAIELAKHISPKKIILISSVANHNQLPKIYLSIGKTGILNLISNSLIKPNGFLQKYLFGAINKKLLADIIQDTPPEFIRWALNAIINWKHGQESSKPVRIHGTKDKLIPLKGEAIEVNGGGHFMIVDKAKEISEIVNEIVQNQKIS